MSPDSACQARRSGPVTAAPVPGSVEGLPPFDAGGETGRGDLAGHDVGAAAGVPGVARNRARRPRPRRSRRAGYRPTASTGSPTSRRQSRTGDRRGGSGRAGGLLAGRPPSGIDRGSPVNLTPIAGPRTASAPPAGGRPALCGVRQARLRPVRAAGAFELSPCSVFPRGPWSVTLCRGTLPEVVEELAELDRSLAATSFADRQHVPLAATLPPARHGVRGSPPA